MIRFTTYLDGLPAPHRLRPAWLRNLRDDPAIRTARRCPGFIGLFHQAVVLPAWTNMEIWPLRDGNVQVDVDPYVCEDGTRIDFQVDGHAASQVTSPQGDQMPGVHGMKILPKLINPWAVITPAGWSTLVLPASLHKQQRKMEAVPGVLNTDVFHQAHLPCRFTRVPAGMIRIEYGEPLAYLIPFQRHPQQELMVETVDRKAFGRLMDSRFLERSDHLPNYGVR